MAAIELFVRACHLAAVQHRGQVRKDAARTPYINHPIQVAWMLAEVGGVTDVEVLAAAVLHDTVEDTPMTCDELRVQFGQRVAGLVAECTDDKLLPKAERKRLQIEHAPHKSPDAKLIKLADKTSNVVDIASADWPAERKREYLQWARQVVEGLRGANAKLDAAFDLAVAQSELVIG